VVLLLVGEPVVGDRAVARLVRAALERDRTTAVTRIDAEEYGAGTLRTLAGPSLFGEPRAIVASRLHRMNDAFLADALEYVAAPEEDVVLIARHDGGTRGRRLLDAIAEAGYQRCEIPAVKTDADKAELVRSDVAGAGRTMTRPAVEALVGDQDVGAAAEDQDRFAPGVAVGDGVDELLFDRRLDEAPRWPAEPEGGVVRECLSQCAPPPSRPPAPRRRCRSRSG